MHARPPGGSRVYTYASPGFGDAQAARLRSSMHGNHVVVMYDWSGAIHVAICRASRLFPTPLLLLSPSFIPLTPASRQSRFAHRRDREYMYVVLRPATFVFRGEEEEEKEETHFPPHFTTGGMNRPVIPEMLYGEFDRIRAKNNPLRRCFRSFSLSLSTHNTCAYLLFLPAIFFSPFSLHSSFLFLSFALIFPSLSLSSDIYISRLYCIPSRAQSLLFAFVLCRAIMDRQIALFSREIGT